ncbi:MAG TPA: hypothetical protein VL866_13400 [Pyrinomonadaceae bacterium]|jgi:hypothetical protein|nr:hypothetical protein [Pyrinomonadaceae bacterium]
MSTGTNTRTVFVAVLGLLVLFFGFILLRVLMTLLIPQRVFVFSVTARTFNILVFSLVALFLSAVFFFARSWRRRHFH